MHFISHHTPSFTDNISGRIASQPPDAPVRGNTATLLHDVMCLPDFRFTSLPFRSRNINEDAQIKPALAVSQVNSE